MCHVRPKENCAAAANVDCDVWYGICVIIQFINGVLALRHSVVVSWFVLSTPLTVLPPVAVIYA